MSDTDHAEWQRTEQYTSRYGSVSRSDGGEWTARVNIRVDGVERVARISETFVSAEVAMGVVVRVWNERNK